MADDEFLTYDHDEEELVEVCPLGHTGPFLLCETSTFRYRTEVWPVDGRNDSPCVAGNLDDCVTEHCHNVFAACEQCYAEWEPSNWTFVRRTSKS